MALQLYKKHPTNLWVIKTYGALLGDWGQMHPPHIEERFKTEAVKVLTYGLTKLRHQDPWLKMGIRNEYYYHSGQFKKQFDLGSKENQFSKAVGASMYAFELLKKGQKSRALKYANLSLLAYKKMGNNEHLRDCFYYQAFAIAKDPQIAHENLTADLKGYKFYSEQKVYFQKYLNRIESLFGT
jgi:hypothetical protein